MFIVYVKDTANQHKIRNKKGKSHCKVKNTVFNYNVHTCGYTVSQMPQRNYL